jgi:hypothetical protein
MTGFRAADRQSFRPICWGFRTGKLRAGNSMSWLSILHCNQLELRTKAEDPRRDGKLISSYEPSSLIREWQVEGDYDVALCTQDQNYNCQA